MSASRNTVSYPDLKGAEQHHDLKNRPGEAGDPDHAISEVEPTEELKQSVAEADSDTQIAAELRQAVADTVDKA